MMGRCRFVLACLVFAQILLVRAMAARSYVSELNPPKVVVRTGDDSHLPVGHTTHTVADPPLSTGATELFSEGEAVSSVAAAPEIGRLKKHRSTDKSVAGGGIIIGGLITAVFAAIYSYVRVTRRRDADKH